MMLIYVFGEVSNYTKLSMSTGKGVTPLFQGFLKKRKDKMRLRWSTYWFRLYKTTLFFYTKKHGHALDLRGQYYIYEVQTVQEVNGPENKRFLFEITLKNGKRKLLAADTADVRQEWMDQLWKAMLLNGSDSNGELMLDNNSETQSESNTEPSSTSGDDRCLSTGQESLQSFTDFIPDDVSSNSDEAGESVHADNDMEQSTEEFLLTDYEYDVLPSRRSAEDTIYDTPTSKCSTNEEEDLVTDSIYDVPHSLIRKLTEHTIESHSSSGRPESGGLLNDMIDCLDSESAAWVKTGPL